jgi:hypothetical protein
MTALLGYRVSSCVFFVAQLVTEVRVGLVKSGELKETPIL